MIQMKNICVQQGAFHLNDINFEVSQGAYAVLMGPSGCGKTSLLEIICGLRHAVSGSVIIAGTDVTHMRPAERNIAYVPQDRALFPGHPVREQLAFALVIRKAPQAQIHQRVVELAEMLGIGHLLDRTPEGLSGGEMQRVSLGRALAINPSVLCLDEPLSALDEDMRDDMCELLQRVHKETGVTVFHITHSALEAQRLGDYFMRMELQSGEPRLYHGQFNNGTWQADIRE
ncbi:MAG: ATP-binding cassette domain-containing protein [Planctomycetes bacterium]|nr:ATP-binding cassette domain-containing protein [Planctomycetota bacterium]